MKNKLVVSLAANIIYVLISLALNFMIVPYIVDRLGSVAYGYNSISDNFVTYATIVTMALNYMGCRFIAYAYHKGDKEESNKYFSSLFFGDVLLGTVISVVSAVIVFNIDSLLRIQNDLVNDVKITFALTFLAFVLQIIMTAFTAGTYVKERMELYALRNIIYTMIRAIVIFSLYTLCKPKIYYISLAACVGNVFCVSFDYFSTKLLIPDLSIQKKDFDKSYIKKLVASGGWYSFVSLGTVLSSGFDLVIANQLIDSYSMGILAVSKTIVAAMNTVRTSIVNVFGPRLVKLYALKSTEEFIEKVNQYMRIIASILYVPLAGLTVFSVDFYRLWLPGYTENEIRIVTALTIWALVSSIASTASSCLPEVYAVVNRLKIPAIVNLLENVFSLSLTFILLIYTDYGVLLIASISSVVFIIYQVIFVIPYASYLLKKSLWCFFLTIVRGLLLYTMLVCTFLFVKQKIVLYNWLIFLIIIAICGGLGYLVTFILMFSSKEKKYALHYGINKIRNFKF